MSHMAWDRAQLFVGQSAAFVTITMPRTNSGTSLILVLLDMKFSISAGMNAVISVCWYFARAQQSSHTNGFDNENLLFVLTRYAMC